MSQWRRLRGQIFALYLFDVAEATDLKAAAADIGGGVRARLAPKPATPSYVQYQKPPLLFEGTAVDIPSIDGFRVGFKLFDYGVISLRLTRDFDGTWPDLAAWPTRSSKTKRSSGRPNTPVARWPHA